jgi:hypothetical protein
MKAVEIHWDDVWNMMLLLSAGNDINTTDAFAYIRVSVKKSLPIALSIARVVGRDQIILFGTIIDVISNSYIKGVIYDSSKHVIVFQDVNYLFRGFITVCDELLVVKDYAHKDISPMRHIIAEALRHVEANLILQSLCELTI